MVILDNIFWNTLYVSVMTICIYRFIYVFTYYMGNSLSKAFVTWVLQYQYLFYTSCTVTKRPDTQSIGLSKKIFHVTFPGNWCLPSRPALTYAIPAAVPKFIPRHPTTNHISGESCWPDFAISIRRDSKIVNTGAFNFISSSHKQKTMNILRTRVLL